MKKSVCIVALSPIAQDARVLRQIKALSSLYDVTVVGYGPSHPAFVDNPAITWMQIPQTAYPAGRSQTEETPGTAQVKKTKAPVGLIDETKRERYQRKAGQAVLLLLGLLFPSFYDRYYARRIVHAAARPVVLSTQCNAYHANDWNALPLAAEAAERNGAVLVLDLHEYAPLEFENRWYWPLTRNMISHIIEEYAPRVDASTTVARLIAERYAKEYALRPDVVLSSPEMVPLPERTLQPDNIQLIHHGVASPVRKPEVMIDTLALCDKRYHLNLMFLPSEQVCALKERAERVVPGRVTFHNAVAPDEIVRRIAQFDVGFCFIPPTNYNYAVCLPNKFFDCVMAGLAVCIGPSPSMAEFVHQYGLGCVSPSFEARDFAKLLNRTTTEQWEAMRLGSRKAASELNAEQEMKKVVAIYDELFGVKNVRNQSA